MIKDIPGYEGLYSVDGCGNVHSSYRGGRILNEGGRMKELKFRVWDKERECYLDETELAGITPDGKYILYIEEEEISKLEIEGDYILEQYTGLKDKNGKEIYEGDIVSVRNKNRKNEYDIGAVEFGKTAFRCQFLLGKYHSGQVEVIGNVHENADLMEKKIMNREELKAAVKKAYGKGYHEGFNDACDTFLPALQAAIIGIVNDMKEPAKEIETFDELEEKE